VTSLKYYFIRFSNDQYGVRFAASDLNDRETTMPLVRISLKKGKPAAYREAIADGVYQALRETFNVPEGDRFVTISEHEDGTFIYDPNYLGIRRTDDLARRNRLFAAIIVEAALGLAAEPAGLDIFHQQRAGAVFRIGQAVMQHLHDDRQVSRPMKSASWSGPIG
jgi:phenylpyruvate tautomerase PptA (4-oxalocrotonate tautomerase family)